MHTECGRSLKKKKINKIKAEGANVFKNHLS